MHTGELIDPFVGLLTLAQPYDEYTLSNTDYRILKTLRRNAKQRIVDIAATLGISAKTIRRRLERMQDHHLANFSIDWAPNSETDIINQLHIKLRDSQNNMHTAYKLMKEYPTNIVFIQSFSNVPTLLLATAWTRSNKETQRLIGQIQSQGFEKVTPRNLYHGYFFSSWRDHFSE